MTSAVYALVPGILREYHRKFSAVEMRRHEMTPARSLHALGQREINVAFVRLPVCEEGPVATEVSRERLGLALPTEHQRAGGGRKRLRDFATEMFIMVPRTAAPGFHDALLGECRRAGFGPRVGHEADEWQTVLAPLAAGLGVALVPESLRHWRRPGVAYLERTPRTAEVPLELVWRRKAARPPVGAFVAVARAAALDAKSA
ncbi:MAG: LysR family substrate-binding domain-containing protein [Undibacterium sp.]|nr:LysR family substrate-binding domain-containing protein [Opitutaceae bacterium]